MEPVKAFRFDVTGKNITSGTAYGNPINARIGDTIRVALNLERMRTTDAVVRVSAGLPERPDLWIALGAMAQTDGTSVAGYAVGATLVVNVLDGTPAVLRYRPGSTRIETIGGPVEPLPDFAGTSPLFNEQAIRVVQSRGPRSQTFYYFDATVETAR